MELGDNIKKYRNIKKITQTDLANMINKSLRMVQKYEANEVTPSLDIIKQIADALDVRLHDLLEKENPINPTVELINTLAQLTLEKKMTWEYSFLLTDEINGIDFCVLMKDEKLTTSEEHVYAYMSESELKTTFIIVDNMIMTRSDRTSFERIMSYPITIEEEEAVKDLKIVINSSIDDKSNIKELLRDAKTLLGDNNSEKNDSDKEGEPDGTPTENEHKD